MVSFGLFYSNQLQISLGLQLKDPNPFVAETSHSGSDLPNVQLTLGKLLLFCDASFKEVC